MKLTTPLRIILMVAGSFLLGFSVDIAINIGLGLSPFDTLNNTLAAIMNIQVGTVIYMTYTVMIIISLLLMKKTNFKAIDILMGFITSIITGYSCNLFMSFASSLGINDLGLISKLLLLAINIIGFGIAIALLIHSNWSVSPIDKMILSIAAVTKKEYADIKVLTDAVLFVIAIAFGLIFNHFPVIGIGTIIFILVTGPVVKICLKFISKIFID